MTFVTTDELTLTNYNHPKPIVYINIYSVESVGLDKFTTTCAIIIVS